MGTNGANFAWVPSVSMLASEHVAGDESSTSKAAVRGASSDWGGDPASSSPLMGGLAVDLPDVFAGEVLRRLSVCDRAMLAWTCGSVRRAVLASRLPRVGTVNHFTRERDADGPNKMHRVFRNHGTEPPSTDEPHERWVLKFDERDLLNTPQRVRWAHARGMRMHWKFIEHASSVGDLEVLKELRMMRCPWNWRASAAAAKCGHLSSLEWLKDNGCPFPWDVLCAFAAEGGHMEVLVWCREKGCPWDSETSAAAAQGGHLPLLKWLHAAGCPWDGETMMEAARRGHREMFEWAKESGCPGAAWSELVFQEEPNHFLASPTSRWEYHVEDISRRWQYV